MSMGEFYAMSQSWDCIYDTWSDERYSTYVRKPRFIKKYNKKELMKEIEEYQKTGDDYENLCWKARTETRLSEISISKMQTSHLRNCVRLIQNKIGFGYGRYVKHIRMLDELVRRNVNIDEFLI